jgi:hypothetical protein
MQAGGVKMFGCQQNLISPDKDLKAILEFLCSQSSKLTNYGIYYARQMYFKTGKIPSRADLHKVLGNENRNLHYLFPVLFLSVSFRMFLFLFLFDWCFRLRFYILLVRTLNFHLSGCCSFLLGIYGRLLWRLL